MDSKMDVHCFLLLTLNRSTTSVCGKCKKLDFCKLWGLHKHPPPLVVFCNYGSVHANDSKLQAWAGLLTDNQMDDNQFELEVKYIHVRSRVYRYTVYIWTTITLCFNRRCSKIASCFRWMKVVIFWLGVYRKTFICLQVVELCHRRIYKAFLFWNVVPFVNGDIVESKCGWFSGWWFISIEKDEWISKPVWHIKDFIFQISIRFFGGRSWSIVGDFDCIWVRLDQQKHPPFSSHEVFPAGKLGEFVGWRSGGGPTWAWPSSDSAVSWDWRTYGWHSENSGFSPQIIPCLRGFFHEKNHPFWDSTIFGNTYMFLHYSYCVTNGMNGVHKQNLACTNWKSSNKLNKLVQNFVHWQCIWFL